MTEKAYEIELISGITAKDGKQWMELTCIDEEKKVLRVLLPVTNMCEYMPFGDSRRCDECEYKNSCEIQAPYEVELGRKIVIVDKGEQIKEINAIAKGLFSIKE